MVEESRSPSTIHHTTRTTSTQASPIKFITIKMQLKLALLATFLTLTLAAPQDEQPALKLRGPDPLPEAATDITPREADGYLFEKRACNYNTGCRSIKGAKSGKYCGYCYQVAYNHPWIGTHIYQLNGKTTKEGCCDYGYNKECAKAYNSGSWTTTGPNCPD